MSSDNRDYREWEAFAKKLAARYVTAGIELADLEQEALLALLEELPAYTPSLGVSLRVFLGRGIRNRLASLYRKTLNLVQIEQFWLVKHVSENRDLHVRTKSKSEAEAVIAARPREYAGIENVKTLASLGPSLDEDAEGNNEGNADCMTLHEVVGDRAEQEWLPALRERVDALLSSEHAAEIETIIKMKQEGYTLDEIGARFGKKKAAVCMVLARAKKRLHKNRAA